MRTVTDNHGVHLLIALLPCGCIYKSSRNGKKYYRPLSAVTINPI